jgi:hypothetical protein
MFLQLFNDAFSTTQVMQKCNFVMRKENEADGYKETSLLPGFDMRVIIAFCGCFRFRLHTMHAGSYPFPKRHGFVCSVSLLTQRSKRSSETAVNSNVTTWC